MKKEYIGLILVRSKSRRLPRKCFLRFGKINLIEHIILRCKFYNIKPIVCTTTSKADNKLIFYAKKHKALYFRGSEKNKIKRMVDCCNKFKIQYFHTVDADDPFFCGKEIIRSINKLANKGLDIVKPSTLSSKGAAIMGYSIRSDAIKKINKKIKRNANTEMIWNFFNLEKKLKTVILNNKKKYSLVRLTLDYYEDYVLLEIIRVLLGNFASRAKIDILLKKYDFLKKVNYFRNNDWKNNQLKN